MFNLRFVKSFFLKGFFTEFNYKLSFFIQFASIPIGITSFYFLSKIVDASSSFFSNDIEFLPFAIIGVASLDLSVSILNYVSRSVREEQITGILEEVGLLNVGYYSYFSFTTIYPFVISIIRMSIYLIFLLMTNSITISFFDVLLIYFAMLLCLLAMNGIAIIASSSILLFKRGNFISSIYISACGLIGGIIYPTTVLPNWLEMFSNIFPTYHLANASRSLLSEVILYNEYLTSLIYLSVLGMIFNIISFYHLAFVIRSIKSKSSLINF